MKIYTNIENIEKFNAKNSVLTIGTFDGVHLGHVKVINNMKKIAGQINGETVLFTFYPHPRFVVSTEKKEIKLITTIEEKKVLLEKAGIDHLIIYPFTKEFSQLSYIDFVKNILVKKLNLKHLVVGYDHKFGHNREGSFEYLKECAKKYNFSIEQTEALNVNNISISSTIIRQALREGDIVAANKGLGYSFSVTGQVVRGKGLGRQIGFPTANIDYHKDKLIPGGGIYAVRVIVDNEIFKGMLNIGFRPTVNDDKTDITFEVNIFDFDRDIYDTNITVNFKKRIRSEKKFESLLDLRNQLKIDKLEALNILK
ncbi:MAG: bifunctional riboflavin kinase/FAD synthetase [Bacteroidetes bacterium]|nr:bifunctional riboflavin kinase/FAD synthetase [Bacteroidota bacterium]